MWPSPPIPTTTTRGARAQQRHGLPNHVHDCESGVSVRGDGGRFQSGRQREHPTIGRLQQLGEPAGTIQTSEVQTARAPHVVTDPAGRAEPAGQLRVADHRVTDDDVLHPWADLLYPAGVLVAQGQR